MTCSVEQLVDRGAVELGAGQHQRGADHRRDKASPQQLAWNIGTTGSITSREEHADHVRLAAINACSTLERCE